MIYVMNRKKTDCNGLEKLVKESLSKKDVSFIPIDRARSIAEE